MYFEECNQEEVITLNEIPLYSPGRARACLEGALQVWDNVPASPYLLTPSRQWLMVVPGRHQTERYTLYLAASFPYTDRTLEHLCKVAPVPTALSGNVLLQLCDEHNVARGTLEARSPATSEA